MQVLQNPLLSLLRRVLTKFNSQENQAVEGLPICDAYTVIFFFVYLTQHTSSVILLLHILIHIYYCFPSLFSITPTFPESKWFRLPTLIVESVNYLSIPDTCQLLTLNAALGATFPVKLYSHGGITLSQSGTYKTNGTYRCQIKVLLLQHCHHLRETVFCHCAQLCHCVGMVLLNNAISSLNETS